MNFDCVSFIDWLMDMVFWLGFLAGGYVGVVVGLILSGLRIVRRTGEDDA